METVIEDRIVWHPASEPPDADTTVLLYGPGYDEVLVGAWDVTADAPCWRDYEGFVCDRPIMHWAHMPGVRELHTFCDGVADTMYSCGGGRWQAFTV